MTATLRRTKLAAAAANALLLGACATAGMGGGELSRKGKVDEPVLFSWTSTDGGISGTMVATLPDATYQGRFFQITQQTQRQIVSPLWDGWVEGWRDWPYWGWGSFGPYLWTEFATRYTGKVLANLKTTSGERMRCRFHMANPSRGMSGGGDGECQLQGGSIVHARFQGPG
jgi:hypothetical protein